MSDNGHSDQNAPPSEKARVDTAIGPVSEDPSIKLRSEALSHLQIQWDQFGVHASNFALNKRSSDRRQLVDDLKRVRNILVVLEKPALEYVVRELLGVFDKDPVVHVANDNELARVLSIAVVQIGKHVHLMQSNSSLENSLALVPLVNDCRACRDDMLLSDSLMVSAGVQLPQALSVVTADAAWSEQRQVWIDFASSRHATLARRLLHWWQKGHAVAVTPLVREIDRFATFAAQHRHLQTLVPLFQAASVVASAVQQLQLDEGPALRGLYAQLERSVHRAELVASPEDLLPRDLLRNFLYYVAQTTSDAELAVELRHRFRLDRVRQVDQIKSASSTPTIGVVYHLTNAIRNGVTDETESLRIWLGSTDKELVIPKFARLRVRLGQLEPILTLMGDVASVQCLQTVQLQLQALGSRKMAGRSLHKDLLQSLSRLDHLLDQSARRSVLSNKPTDTVQLSHDNVYLDIATDACLREARHDLAQCANKLLPMLSSGVIDEPNGHQIIGFLNTVDGVADMLQLPEASSLFRSLVELLGNLFMQTTIPSPIDTEASTGIAKASSTQSLHSMFSDLFVSLDNYLGSVFLTQPTAAQFLNESQEVLGQLKPTVEAMLLAAQVGPSESALNSAKVERWFDDLSATGSDSLTLNVDDELLLQSHPDAENPSIESSSLQRVFEHECIGHLESLDESVRAALQPNAVIQAQLPNERMLRALHTLTGSAQTISATAVVAIAQPLQRASLALHREGCQFNAEQTRIIGELVLALRARLNMTDAGRPIHENVMETERLLGVLLAQTVGSSQNSSSPLPEQSPLTISSQVSSLNDVFAGEAAIILDQLRDSLRRQPFATVEVTESLALLHTLKGTARIAGKQSICDCAHALEHEVQTLSAADKQLVAFEQGCRLLQRHLMQVMAKQVASTSSGLASLPGKHNANLEAEDQRFDDVGPRKLLELTTNLSFNQARVADELRRLNTVCDDIQSGAMRLRELRRNSDLPASPAFNEIIADMEASRMAMLDALRQTQQRQKQSSTLSSSLQQAMVRSQLMQVDQIRDRLTATIDDVARHVGVSARLQISGGDLMLDKRVFRSLMALSEHLARNAIIHGIETGEKRRLSGKSDVGLLALDFSMDGTTLTVSFSDDGRGVSPVVAKTLQANPEEAAPPSASEVQALLFTTGFSSLENADVFAGHGLGLSAVKTMVEQMGGQVYLGPLSDNGFVVTMRIPQQLFVNQVILVESDARLFGIPVAQTRTVQLTKDSSVAQPKNTTNSNSPAVALHTLLGEPEVRSGKSSQVAKPSIWVDVAGESMSIEVDKVLGYRELVVQNLGPQMGSLKSYSAGSVLNGDQQVLIVDLSTLLSKSASEQPKSQPMAYEDCRPMALVVDDSPTTCRTARSLLLSRGIDVSICRDGLEALDFVTRQLPQLMIVDLEMPRMDGFTLIRRIRAEFDGVVPPFVIVGSRDDKQNREMAKSLGAVTFLAKPYDEKQLQDAVQMAGLRLPDLTIA